jgi:hypothetical protein
LSDHCDVTATSQSGGPEPPSGAYCFAPVGQKKASNRHYYYHITYIYYTAYIYYAYYTDYQLFRRFVSISKSPITSGRKSAQPMPRVSMDWVINLNLNCVLLGWRTSARPIPMGRLRNLTSWETARWRLMIEFLMLLDCMLANPPWWMSQLASFLH